MINIKVSDNTAFSEGGIIPSGGVKSTQVTFDFSEEWSKYAVTAQFEGCGETKHLADIKGGVAYDIPFECIAQPGTIRITLFGTSGDSVKTVVYTTLRVHDSGVSEGSAPSDPTPSVYEQLLDNIKATQSQVSAAEDLLKRATDGNIYELTEGAELTYQLTLGDDVQSADTLLGIPLRVLVCCDGLKWHTGSVEISVVGADTWTYVLTDINNGVLSKDNIITIALLSDGKMHVLASAVSYIPADSGDIDTILEHPDYADTVQATSLMTLERTAGYVDGRFEQADEKYNDAIKSAMAPTIYELGFWAGVYTMEVSGFGSAEELKGIILKAKVNNADGYMNRYNPSTSGAIKISCADFSEDYTCDLVGLGQGKLTDGNILTMSLLSDGKMHILSSETTYLTATDEDINNRLIYPDFAGTDQTSALMTLERTAGYVDGRFEQADEKYSNALNGTASGDGIIRLNHISPLAHKVVLSGAQANGTVSIYGKNLIRSVKQTQTVSGVTFTLNDDGSVKMSGTNTGTSVAVAYITGKRIYLPAGTYTLSSAAPSDSGVSLRLAFYVEASGGSQIGTKDAKPSKTFTLSEGVYSTGWITVTAGTSVDLTLYPQLEAGNTATEYEPFREPQTISADSDGHAEIAASGGTMTVISDGTLSAEYNKDINAVIEELTNAISAITQS